MHPTRDTTAFITGKGAGGRVMPGVSLLAIIKNQSSGVAIIDILSTIEMGRQDVDCRARCCDNECAWTSWSPYLNMTRVIVSPCIF
jgi:hypothetical protein